MSITVAKLVTELRRDHQNMGLLLNLVERETDDIYSGGTPDFELLYDVMHYMTIYPDVVHHPREDILYAEMRRVRPDLSRGFQRIGMDHRHIENTGHDVRDVIAAINAGTVLDRKEVVTDILRYVHGLRSHMQWEELDLFGRALQMARDGHTHIDVERPGDRDDPLFGGKVDSDFAALHKELRRAGERRARAVS